MTLNTKHTMLLLVLVISFIPELLAQSVPDKNWDAEKIKGVRHMLYPAFSGSPFLTTTFEPGEITFKSGETIDSLHLKYSAYKDELLYYNRRIGAQIVIDKEMLSEFTYTDTSGKTHRFVKLPYDDYLKGDHYFELLANGDTKLLVFRKVELISTTPYRDEQDILKNMEYSPAFAYMFYKPEHGYADIKCNTASFLTRFAKAEQKAVKKILRKERIRVKEEESLIRAWLAVEKAGFKVQFRN